MGPLYSTGLSSLNRSKPEEQTVREHHSDHRIWPKDEHMTNELGNWAVNYLPREGGRFTGKLKLADDKLKFTSLYESSNKTIVKAIFLDVGSFAAAGGHTVYRYSNDDELHIELPVTEIATVRATKKGVMKQAVVTMQDGEEFVFDHGMLNVKKIVEAIESVITT
ncbi:MAG: hypothetical protein ACI9N0_002799 [Ilumatobacter sp.]|jgi:hypothetical protein